MVRTRNSYANALVRTSNKAIQLAAKKYMSTKMKNLGTAAIGASVARQAVKMVTQTPTKGTKRGPSQEVRYLNKKMRHTFASIGRNKGGYYRGYLRAKKRTRRANKYYKKGAVFKKERGGVLSTSIAHSGYLGHSVAPNVMSAQVWRAVVKDLFNKAGIEFGSFDDRIARRLVIPGGFEAVQIMASYRVNADDITVPSTSSVVMEIFNGTPIATATFEGLASQLDAQLRADIVSIYTEDDSFRFINFTLLGISDFPEGLNKQPLANLNPQDLFIDVNVNSKLTIQNRTNDAAGGTNVDSTSNNPIIGRMYEQTSKWYNGFEMKISPLEANPLYEPLLSDIDTGLIVASSDPAYTGAKLPNQFQKPPPGWLLGAKKTQRVVMQPGQIKTMKLNWHGKMGFNTYMRKLYNAFTAAQSGKHVFELGFAQLIGLECLLYDRVETTNLQLAYEINQTYSTTLVRKKIKTVPKIDVV